MGGDDIQRTSGRAEVRAGRLENEEQRERQRRQRQSRVGGDVDPVRSEPFHQVSVISADLKGA